LFLGLSVTLKAEPIQGEVSVTEDVTVRVKPGLSDIEENPLSLVLDGTVDFLVNVVTW
jgi:hypothetical protein